jgi:hypothetical protein
MSMNISIKDYIAPNKCYDCKFINHAEVRSGRYFIFQCRLTDIGDDYCESGYDLGHAEKIMREQCPLKGKK